MRIKYMLIQDLTIRIIISSLTNQSFVSDKYYKVFHEHDRSLMSNVESVILFIRYQAFAPNHCFQIFTDLYDYHHVTFKSKKNKSINIIQSIIRIKYINQVQYYI